MDDQTDVDLFAGPGGWEVAARRLGRRVVGIEWDKAACATRAAAGHLTIRASVADYPPCAIGRYRRIGGVIASPPCKAFSQAGGKAGRAHVPALVTAARTGDWGARPDPDPLVWLSLEPGRWIEALQPEWVAMEQAPSVLPLWQAYASWLEGQGYSAWAGVLSAEWFGVPQVRKRAVLMASRVRPMGPPQPTHRGWDARNRRVAPDDLFGLQPFVTMAHALGWDDPDVRLRTGAMTFTGDASIPRTLDQPAPTIAFGNASSGWAWERPSTTIVGSFRPDIVAAPGYRKPGDPPRQNTPGSVQVTLEQAATLQSFPDGYPWQGSKGKRFQQVGNAVPPLLAQAILGALVGQP